MVNPEPQFHILAVDDSSIDRKLIERLLKTCSFKVTTVDSGSKALEFLGWNQDQTKTRNSHVEVNLVITDYCMPEMSGYDLLKKLKESSCLRDIPVVIMSSENVPSRINRCLEEGAKEFLLKPVRLADVNKLMPHIIKSKGKNAGAPPVQPDGIEELRSNFINNKKRKSSSDEPDRVTRARLGGLTVQA